MSATVGRRGHAAEAAAYSPSGKLTGSGVSLSTLCIAGGGCGLGLCARRVFALVSPATGNEVSAIGSFAALTAGAAAERRPRLGVFLETAAFRAVAGARAAGLRTAAALRVVAVARVEAAVFRVLADVFRAVVVAVLRAAVAVLRAVAVPVLRAVGILRAAAAGLRVAVVLREAVVAVLRVAADLRAVTVVFAAARFVAGAALRVVAVRAAGLRDAAVFAAALRRPAAVVFAAAGLRALAVVFFAAVRTGVFTVFAAAFVVLDAAFGAGLRAVDFAGAAARFAGARRVDALTAIAWVRRADPVSPELSLLTASLLLSR